MMSNDYEKAFGLFVETKEYDGAESALFDIVRLSFEAGWKAAGGEPPVPHRIFELVNCKAEEL